MPDIILASASPRRKELLQQLNIPFRVIPAEVDEVTLKLPHDTVLHNAVLKAQKVAQQFPHHIIIAADTIVNFNNQILGKPANLEEAREMLALLSNSWHQVFTATVIITPNYNNKWVATADVLFHKLTSDIIEQYIYKINPLDKAGSYNINEQTIPIIKQKKGSDDTIMGLPIEKLKKCLQQLNAIN